MSGGAERKATGARIVFTAFGSMGDIHPYIAVARELLARGHRPVIATSAYYRAKIEGEGIGFRPVRPDLPDLGDEQAVMRRLMHPRRGTEYVIREVCMPHLRATYADTLDAVRGADLLITHPMNFAGLVVAEQTGICWGSSVLSPISFLSVCEAPILAPMPWLARVWALGPPVARVLRRTVGRAAASWLRPVAQLRADIGLPPGANPLLDGQHSPRLVLALFSSVLGQPQPDWPRQTRVTGFAFYDRNGEAGLEPELRRFLSAGPSPVAFTLGSSAVRDPGRFFRESAEAARVLGVRAVLLAGEGMQGVPAPLPEGVAAFAYAPYSEIFPRAAAIVHQGGVGTTAQALGAGRPMLVVPYSHDQPDNAARVVRLGVARTIDRGRYVAALAAAELRRLLDDPALAARAAEVGRQVRAEDGARAACDAIEELLSR